jgi:hypothetical protein
VGCRNRNCNRCAITAALRHPFAVTPMKFHDFLTLAAAGPCDLPAPGTGAKAPASARNGGFAPMPVIRDRVGCGCLEWVRAAVGALHA